MYVVVASFIVQCEGRADDAIAARAWLRALERPAMSLHYIFLLFTCFFLFLMRGKS